MVEGEVRWRGRAPPSSSWKIICGVETCSGLGLGPGLDDLADDPT